MRSRVVTTYVDSAGALVTADEAAISWADRVLSEGSLGGGSRVSGDSFLGEFQAAPPIPRSGWGVAIQLYALSGGTSAGIGDLGLLRRAAEVAARSGASFLLLNPICLAPTSGRCRQDPYAPGSRLFRDPIYLDIERAAADERLSLQTHHRELLDELRSVSSTTIAWEQVRRVKDQILQDLYRSAKTEPDGFAEYIDQLPAESLFVASFLVSARRFGPNWWNWPAEANAAGRADDARFGSDVYYELWLQWLILNQLRDVQRVLPILMDLPVGVAADGADCWLWPEVISRQTELGAPPDTFNTDGQNWHIHGWHPDRLREEDFRPLRITIRESIRGVAGLRIDHVMGFQRIFWVPCGGHASEGVYIAHDLDEGMSVLISEARNVGAFIFGEDLGTVSDEMRDAMREASMPGFRLLYQDLETNTFTPDTVGMVSNHDTPTTLGLLSGADVAYQRSVGLDCDIGVQGELAIKVEAAVDGTGSLESRSIDLYRRLGNSRSDHLIIQIEDVLGARERPHFPGAEFGPMWDRRHTVDVDEWDTVSHFVDVTRVMSQARPR